MVKQKSKIEVGNVLMILALLFTLAGSTLIQVKAAQGNESYHYVFGGVGSSDDTSSRTKWASSDPAFINCTSTEVPGSYFNAWFYYWNSNDGTQSSNAVQLGYGDQRWVSNGALSGDTTWFHAELSDDGGTGEGGIFDGRWRPDSSY